MDSVSLLDNFYESSAGRQLVRTISKSFNDHGERTLVLGYGKYFLDAIESQEIYYANPFYDHIHYWPSIRPFRTVSVNAAKLPFMPNVWDTVAVIHYLEFTDNATDIIKDIYRVIKTNGRLIIVLANKSAILENSSLKLNSIILDLISFEFTIGSIVGVNKHFDFWPYRIGYSLNRYSEVLLRFFPFLSDVIVISAEKILKAPYLANEFSEGYEVL